MVLEPLIYGKTWDSINSVQRWLWLKYFRRLFQEPNLISQDEFENVFKNMIKNESIIIRIASLHNPIKTISHIDFDSLILLGLSIHLNNLVDCNIISTEWISYIKMPRLSRLDLSFNNIYRLQGMIKTNEFSNLDAFNLSIIFTYLRLEPSSWFIKFMPLWL